MSGSNVLRELDLPERSNTERLREAVRADDDGVVHVGRCVVDGRVILDVASAAPRGRGPVFSREASTFGAPRRRASGVARSKPRSVGARPFSRLNCSSAARAIGAASRRGSLPLICR